MSVPPSRALDDVLLLPPIVVLFRGGRIFGRYLGLDEVLRIGLPRIGSIHRMKDSSEVPSIQQKQGEKAVYKPGSMTRNQCASIKMCLIWILDSSFLNYEKETVFKYFMLILSIFKNKFCLIYLFSLMT